ncbi:GGDEF domain-containing protein [Aquincola sp. MAHUQ-54]|uniref:diguanylate cyclase n=1 Tax=Aquincola agrisoli TaxID=3119538 RepID=A0AAW9Q7D7_9BURK
MLDSLFDSAWMRWLDRQVPPSRTWFFAGPVALAAGAAASALALLAGWGLQRTDLLPLAAAAGLGTAAASALFAMLVAALVNKLRTLQQSMTVMATRDDLTGVLNRRQFTLLAEREWARCRRYEADGAVLLVDADHFRRINEQHGHAAGDALLREIVRVTGGLLRQADVLARADGEALVVLLPQTDPLGALDVAERIREHVAALRLDWQGTSVFTTVSVGVASMGALHTSLDALMLDAEHALGAAKAAGRNCVRAAPIQPRRSGEARPVISK